MSTAPVSATSIYQEIQSFYQNRQSDLSQLGQALQNGDLAGAQQAYSTLVSLGQEGPFANSEPFYNSSRTQEFETIGQDLQNGDLAGAQAAFAQLTSKQASSSSSSDNAAADTVNLTTPTVANASATSTTDSIYEQLQEYRQERQSDLNQLGQDLQAGNLTAAQQDYATLVALGQSGPNKNGQPFENSTRAQDFSAIGQALQNGDLAGAQGAFANLESTFGKQAQSGPVASNTSPTASSASSNSTNNTSSNTEIVAVAIIELLNNGSASNGVANGIQSTPQNGISVNA
jgi:hypothetical protein